MESHSSALLASFAALCAVPIPGYGPDGNPGYGRGYAERKPPTYQGKCKVRSPNGGLNKQRFKKRRP